MRTTTVQIPAVQFSVRVVGVLVAFALTLGLFASGAFRAPAAVARVSSAVAHVVAEAPGADALGAVKPTGKRWGAVKPTGKRWG